MTTVASTPASISVPTPRDPRAAETVRPDPPRFWWLKRLTAGCLLLAVALLAVRAAWGWEAERRFRRALEPVLARGDPTVAAEWNPKPVAEAVNGAAHLRRAAAAVNQTAWSPANTSMNFPAAYTPDSPNWNTIAAQSVAANGAVFPLARRARTYQEFDWGTRAMTPLVRTLLPHLNDVRMLANTLGDSAMYAHEQGDDVAALETIRDVRHVAKAARSEPVFVCALVGIGIDNVANSRLLEMAPGLRIGADDAAAPDLVSDAAAAAAGPFPTTRPAGPPRAVGRAHVRALVNELLDDRDAIAGLRRALAGERVMQLDLAEWLGGRTWLLRPMYRLDAARMLDGDEVLDEAAARGHLPAARAVLARGAGRLPPARPPGKGSIFSPAAAAATGGRRERVDVTHLLSSEFLGGPGAQRIIVQHLRATNERRMTAVSLAAQVYRADHGDWPPSIEALVPRYLPEVPADALAPEGEKLRYLVVPKGLPDGRDRPIVYSAGENGVYDTRDPSVLPGAPLYGWTRTTDEWRDLARWTPAAPATAPSPATAPAGP